MDHNQERRRGHFHRGRRGPDRRTPPPQAQAQEHGGRDHVDVEQIMRDIRSRIAQRHGIELSNQQIQELAARRLEAILDPRSLKPALLDELRRSAGTPAAPQDPADAAELTYAFEDTTLYESHRGVLRVIRRLLNPILKLFFNPNPLIQALNIQARWNAEAARRQAERERRQTEWNALHYELLHRMVTEVSRVSLELQSQSMQIESLAAKVDFNERRVRSIEGALHQARPAARTSEPAVTPIAPSADTPGIEAPPEGPPSDSARRRRRRRRGRRGSGAPGEGAPGSPHPAAAGDTSDVAQESSAVDEGPDDEPDQGEAEIITASAVPAAPAAPAEPVAAESHTSEPAPPAQPAAEQREPDE